MSLEDIRSRLAAAATDFRARKLENAYGNFRLAEDLAKAILDVGGDPVDEEAYEAYYITTALGVGDTLVLLERNFPEAIDRYLRVKAYRLGENPVKPIALWLRLVRASLAEGDAAFRRGNERVAKAAYGRVLVSDGTTVRPATGALFDGHLNIMTNKVNGWLKDSPTQIETADARDYPPEQLVALSAVRQRIEHLDNGLNFLGYPPNYAPIFSFGRLQDLARSFAKFAAQANREYVSFTQMAEQETQTLRQFEQAVNLNQAAVDIERSRADVVEREIDAAEDAVRVAQSRAQRAERAAQRFATTGWELARLQAAQAWSGAAAVSPEEEIKQSYRGLEDLGVSSRYMRRAELSQTLSWEAARRSYSLEAARQRDAATDLHEAISQVKLQFAAARARRNAAVLSVDSARWRYRASIENLARAREEVISDTLLFELGTLALQTAEIYLSRATEAAFLMERAYNLENSTEIRRIRLDYGDLAVADGLYAADFLLRDIDEFALQAVAGVQHKVQSAVRIISLKRDFPFAFYNLLTSGEAQFETTLEDFHDDLPGTFDGRIRRVRVVIEGGTGPDGVAGMLTCAATSHVRLPGGKSFRKAHSSETLILPRVTPVAPIDEPLGTAGQLEVFENVGVATSWNLRIPPQWNAIDLRSMNDVKLAVAYYFRHDPTLEAKDLADQPERSEGEYLLDLTRGHRAWQALEVAGNATLKVTTGMIPPHHALETTIRGLVFIILRPDGTVQPATIRLTAASGATGSYATGLDGVITVASVGAPGAFGGEPFVQDFTLELPRAENPGLFLGPGPGANLSGIYLIEAAVNYDYKLRRHEE